MLLFLASDPHHGLGLRKFLLKESGWTIAYPYPCNTASPKGKGLLPIPLPRESSSQCNTLALLNHPTIQNFLENHLRVTLVIFKNSHEIQLVVNGYPNVTLVANPPLLAQRIENKLHTISLLQDLPTLPALILSPEELPVAFEKWGKTLVAQLPRGHSGNGTFLLTQNAKLPFLIRRPLKVMPYWPGETYTVNACVSSKEMWISFPLKQLTGMAALTPHALGSCGNDFDFEDPNLERYASTLQKLTSQVGKRLQEMGFRGIFGVDFLIPYHNKQPYILEINPRLTGNTAFSGLLGCDLILKHLKTYEWEPLLNLPAETELTGGAQLIFRKLGKEQIDTSLASGVYRLKKGKFSFVSTGWNFSSLADDEYLILFRRREELFRIQKNKPLRCWETLQNIFYATQEFMVPTVSVEKNTLLV